MEDAIWSRDSVVSCSCSEKGYRHVHCPCEECEGKACPRTVEMLHWKRKCALNANTPSSQNSCQIEAMEEERIESYPSYPSCSLTSEQSETSDSHLIDHDNQDLLHTSLSTEHDGNTSNTNDHDFQNENERKTSLKFLIVEMVLDAMKLTEKQLFCSCF